MKTKYPPPSDEFIRELQDHLITGRIVVRNGWRVIRGATEEDVEQRRERILSKHRAKLGKPA